MSKKIAERIKQIQEANNKLIQELIALSRAEIINHPEGELNYQYYKFSDGSMGLFQENGDWVVIDKSYFE